jgi:hypothetical protein
MFSLELLEGFRDLISLRILEMSAWVGCILDNIAGNFTCT